MCVCVCVCVCMYVCMYLCLEMKIIQYALNNFSSTCSINKHQWNMKLIFLQAYI